MPRIEIYMPDGFKETLRSRANQEDMSVSEYIRKTSDYYDINKTSNNNLDGDFNYGYQPTSGRNGYQPALILGSAAGYQPIRTTEQSQLPPPPSGGDATK